MATLEIVFGGKKTIGRNLKGLFGVNVFKNQARSSL